MSYRSLNPATGELLEEFAIATDSELETGLNAADEAYSRWRSSPLDDRRALLEAVATELEGRAERLARVAAIEMGKPLAEGIGEARKCAWVCRYYAEHAEAFTSPRRRDSDGSRAWVQPTPRGPVLAIMPWNFPFWQVLRCTAPAIAGGNAVILKHAPCTPRCALELAEIFAAVGAPTGLFQSFFLSNAQAALAIADPRVASISLTGSSGAGRTVAALAGAALKPMVAELGGSDPFIVFAGADLERAIEVGVAARLLNAGQSCIAAKRFVLDDAIADEFLEGFVTEMTNRRLGDPLTEGVQVGPMARQDLRESIAAQVETSIAAGSRVLCGGERLEGPGFFYPPTVLDGAPEGTPAADEELFGPVAVIQRFSSEDEAVAIANATEYGLGASLWTDDRSRSERLISRLEAGSVFVNGMVKSDPRLPFGGTKTSGFGLELGREGFDALVNLKTVWVA